MALEDVVAAVDRAVLAYQVLISLVDDAIAVAPVVVEYQDV